MSKRILIVEDEKAIAESLAYSMRKEGFEVQAVADGETALRTAEEFKPDLVILDILLPAISGLDVCRVLRARSTVPIVMLTAKAEEVDRVVGLEMGADDYITKPFSIRELIARVRAALRRAEMTPDKAPVPHFDDGRLKVDFSEPSVTLEGKPVVLAPRELQLLRALVAHRGRVRTRQQLLEEAWGGDDYIDPRTVDVHIRWLRKKLEPGDTGTRYIETIRGLGYRFIK